MGEEWFDHLREVEKRLRTMRNWINPVDWDSLCRAEPEAKHWFDENGDVV